MAHGPGDWFSATCIGTAFALHLDAFALHLRCICGGEEALRDQLLELCIWSFGTVPAM
jgi:hypothetical protein